MADDIFLTPEEQDERARQWLKDNGPALVIGIALGLGAIFGWNHYKDTKLKNAEQASVVYQAALEEFQSSELSDIDAQVTELKEKYTGSSYAAKAALLKAKQLSISDLGAAFNELQWVLDNAQESGLQHTARIRQAKIKLAQGELDAAQALAAHVPTLGFESHYAELLADIALQKGDYDTARTEYQRAIDKLPAGQTAYTQILTIKMQRVPGEAAEVAAESEPEVAEDRADTPTE